MTIFQKLEQEVRDAYKGIISDELIEATVQWWAKKAEEIYEVGYREGGNSVEDDVDNVLDDVCDIEYDHWSDAVRQLAREKKEALSHLRSEIEKLTKKYSNGKEDNLKNFCPDCMYGEGCGCAIADYNNAISDILALLDKE